MSRTLPAASMNPAEMRAGTHRAITRGVRLAAAAALLIGCTWTYPGQDPGTDDGSGAPDVRPDAYIPPYMPPTSCSQALPIRQYASCQDGVARVETDYYYMGAGTHSMCGYQKAATAMCTEGCAVESSLTINSSTTGGALFEIANFGNNAALLCAETAEAKVGDSCTAYFGDKPCLPTRARLNSDGTVATQSYLYCDPSTLTCVSAGVIAPTGYLLKCSDTIIAQYGVTGVNGHVTTGLGACLLAWDSATQSVKSGISRVCVGDWNCPQGALCDDGLDPLDGLTPRAVCKPGPRGVLTPAMLQ
jgi:hypothetical protein